jgi:hypothetical protein
MPPGPPSLAVQLSNHSTMGGTPVYILANPTNGGPAQLVPVMLPPGYNPGLPGSGAAMPAMMLPSSMGGGPPPLGGRPPLPHPAPAAGPWPGPVPGLGHTMFAPASSGAGPAMPLGYLPSRGPPPTFEEFQVGIGIGVGVGAMLVTSPIPAPQPPPPPPPPLGLRRAWLGPCIFARGPCTRAL